MDAQNELVSETGAMKHAALTLYCYYCLRRNKQTGLCFPSLRQTVKDTGISPKSNVSMLRHFLEEVGWIEVSANGVIRLLKGFYPPEEIFKIRFKKLLFDRITVLLIRTIVLQNRTPVLLSRTLFKGILNQPNQPAHLTSVSADSPKANPANAPDDKIFDNFVSAPKPTPRTPAATPKPAFAASAEKPTDERINHPAVQMVREITGRYPPKTLWDRIIREIKNNPKTEFFRASWEIWLSVGGNPQNFEKWLFEPQRTGLPPEVFDKANRKTPDRKPVKIPVEESGIPEKRREALKLLSEVQAEGEDVSDYQKWYTPEDWQWLQEQLKTG